MDGRSSMRHLVDNAWLHLFRIDPDKRVTPLLRNLGIPNTLLWSDDGTRLVFGDSMDATLYSYFIHTDGNLDVANVWYGPDEQGGPDGSARPDGAEPAGTLLIETTRKRRRVPSACTTMIWAPG